MPVKKLCRKVGCNDYAIEGEAYCEKHWNGPRVPFESARKDYNYELWKTKRWRVLRSEHIRHNPVCSVCGCDTDLVVHHITRPKGDEDLFFNPENLMTLCKQCHLIHFTSKGL